MRTLSVEYRHDPDTGGWTATMPEVLELVTQGRTLKETHGRVRSALGLVVDEPESVMLKGHTVWSDRPDLSQAALELVRQESDLRVQSLDLQARLEAVTAAAVQKLLQERQTFRAAGQLLGITHQRVEQIARRESEDNAP